MDQLELSHQISKDLEAGKSIEGILGEIVDVVRRYHCELFGKMVEDVID